MCTALLASLSKPFPHQAVAPECFVSVDQLAQLVRREAGFALHVARHVCLVGEPGLGGELRQSEILPAILGDSFMDLLRQNMRLQTPQ